MSETNIVPLRSLHKNRKQATYLVHTQNQLRLEGMREYLITAFEAMMGQFFLKLSQQSISSMQANARISAGQLLERQSEVSLNFIESVLNEFDVYWSHKTDRAFDLSILNTPDYDALSETELDELAALSSLSEKAWQLYNDDLRVLAARFNEIKYADLQGEMAHPLIPEVLVLLFRRMLNLASYSVDTGVRTIAYRCFDQTVLHYLGGILNDWNTLWAEEGVLPELISVNVHPNILQYESEAPELTNIPLTLDEPPPSLLNIFLSELETDARVNDDIKELLHSIASPLQQVETREPDFMLNMAHVATQLIDQLVSVGLCLSDEASHTEEQLIRELERKLSPLMAMNRPDDGLINGVFEGIVDCWEMYERASEKESARLIEVRSYQEKMHLARKNIKVLLEPIIEAHREFPELTALLREGWHDVLLFSLVRDGDDSDIWQANLKVLRDLVWSVSEKKEKPERAKLLQRIPTLITEIREGLVGISFDHQRTEELLKGIQRVHIRVLGGQVSHQEHYLSVLEYQDEDSIPVGEAWGHEENILKALAAQHLVVGQWVLWKKQNRQFKGRIAWQSNSTGSSLIVDSNGQKISEIPQEHMLSWVVQKQLEILPVGNYCRLLLNGQCQSQIEVV